ncbi:MarR family winged helix-turn-helix transcriptional regulator [Crossiella cryophila]|uniref:DNA-binding MarR family transcriptional regulator n=1 Tax=Crossiella cryophila TaxID=43355 RepID=A0A7W7FU72_9PSEU|nr:MarR family transcriptional regulator [Crossiella cryophila]MBB4677962.1 DNA-binding MarR family transcriptional regulator [Crossiella cryophila]
MSEAPHRLSSRPSYLLTQTATHARRLVTEAFTSEGARGYQYRLLATLHEFGPASQADLGRRGNMDRSDVVGTLNELVAQGHADRTPDPADARRNIIHLTAAGEAHLRRLDTALDTAQNQLTAPLSAAERTQLVDLLTRLLAHHTPD